jgi:hypothetical protein
MAAWQGDFQIKSETFQAGGKVYYCKPSISTFSDHIVISYPLRKMTQGMEAREESTAASASYNNVSVLLQRITFCALRLGLLIRGGATIGKLFHDKGVVFGDALIEAYDLESKAAIYPRVVLAPKVTSRAFWLPSPHLRQDADGLFYFDYLKPLLHGIESGPGAKDWIQATISTIDSKRRQLTTADRVGDLAKWNWFAKELRRTYDARPPVSHRAFGTPNLEML